MEDVNSPDKWAADYERGTDRWDLGRPTPVFQQIATSDRFAPGNMIVLGAGRGYDAREFARHGYAVTAVDFTPYAASEMQRLATPDAPVEIIQQDIFTLPSSRDGTFDYVLEYTCFCAIDPQRRSEYADLVARLLRPGALYIDLAFPLDEHAGGPPFAVSVDEVLDLFERREFRLLSREAPAASVPQRQGNEELLIFQKAGGA